MDRDLKDIQRILAGDRQGYGAILSRYRDYVYTVTYRVLRNEQLAEEAAQDTFVKAFDRLSDFRGESKFSTWLYRIAWTTAISQLRKEKRHFSDGLDIIEDTAADESHLNGFETLVSSERSRLIEQALNHLSTDESMAISLFYLQDRPLAEIAEIVGDTVNTVKVRLFRARKRLSVILQLLLQEEVSEL